MANRRMFSLDVVDTDRFLDMSASAQPLLMPDISECITGMIKYRKKCGRLMFTRLELRPRMYFL